MKLRGGSNAIKNANIFVLFYINYFEEYKVENWDLFNKMIYATVAYLY